MTRASSLSPPSAPRVSERWPMTEAPSGQPKRTPMLAICVLLAYPIQILRHDIQRYLSLQPHNRLDAIRTTSNQKTLTATSHEHQLSLPSERQRLDKSQLLSLSLTLMTPALQQPNQPPRKSLHIRNPSCRRGIHFLLSRQNPHFMSSIYKHSPRLVAVHGRSRAYHWLDSSPQPRQARRHPLLQHCALTPT